MKHYKKMNYKIRESVTRKIPFTLILGDNEKNNDTISFRKYGSNETNTLNVDYNNTPNSLRIKNFCRVS